MDLGKLVLMTRSCRRFDESLLIDRQLLEGLVNLARLSASGANRQPLKYIIVNSPDTCQKVFPFLAWAGYLTEWPGPGNGERPSAYIVVAGDRSVTDNFGIDHGIAAQTIMLGATEAGYGGCIIASIKRQELADSLGLTDNFEILLVLALGKPVEKIILEDIKDNDVRYWRDSEGNHHVPKRKLEDIILKL
ncbi:MAG: nitroreductase family protein [Bacteroidales bacterium]|jgi:nitroreductase|nr:nitroreductase family protein [Bacteroidales bacterium]